MTGPARVPDALTPPEAEAVLGVLHAWSGRLYAVLDAAREPAVMAYLRGSGLRHESLFDGWTRTVMSEAGPHLVALPRGGLATRRLIERGWGRGWGVLALSNEGFAGTRRQLRRLLTVRVPGGGHALFRFYDPRLLPTFIASCDPRERARAFGRIEGFLCEGPDGHGEVLAFAREGVAEAHDAGVAS